MNKILTKICTVALMLMMSMGAMAKVDIKIESFTGGKITATQGDEKDGKVTITLTVTPNDGYTIIKDDIYVYATISPSETRGNTPTISGRITLDGNDPKDLSEKRDYTFTITTNFGVWVKEAYFSDAGGGGKKRGTPTPITSLSQITDANGDYVITQNISGGTAGVSTFSGTLEANIDPTTNMPYRISSLSAPLFTTLTGTVKNLVLEDVGISNHTGNTGAIACTANGSARIYNVGILSGSVGGTGYTGGLVGLLEGTARVINCYSFANITGGTTVGGIVGNNNGTTTAASINTMVMNCMFYGDITGGTNKSPVYGGTNINNLQGGLNTFNYYAYEKLPTNHISSGKYNNTLAMEEKYLNRFEFYRLLLNSNKKLAAFYITGNPDDANLMAKWVLETADRSISGREPYPYPVLKAQGFYPSIINPDFTNAPDSASVGRNHGGKLGKTLSVTISMPNTPTGGVGKPNGASLKTENTSLTLTRTDKDFDRFNYNYDKVQLPYYNDVGTGNYTGNKAVTGWMITAITTIAGDPYTSTNYPTSGITDYPNHNYADRKSSNKDKYSISGRVFSQGAYFDVPYGVESITIEPYWGNAIYVADQYYDVVYKNDYSGKQGVSQTGTQVANNAKFNDQSIKTSITGLGSGTTVYDNAVVLVGNFHLDGVPSNGTTPFTMMSVDEDNDHEPDYSLIYHHKGRLNICPIRFDFLDVIGTAQAQKPNGASLICNFTICKTRGWFEITNTALIYSSQFEYENLSNKDGDNSGKVDAPLILLGGVFDQFVSTQNSNVNGKVYYIHVGSNVWINEFGMGTHSDGDKSTPHVPVSVTGGEFPGFYLTGTYNANAAVRSDNAECYISSGYFHEAAGASQEGINGNVRWQIYNADIDNFFGGGTNDAKPIQGDVTVDIYNSYVTTYCGGPKFGNMQAGKKVTTNAEGCTFGTYFGAGYGGLSYSRKKYYDNTTPAWGTTLQGYYTTDKGKYFDGETTNSRDGGTGNNQYGKKGPGVATDFDYEFFVWSSGSTGGRFFVKFASFSLAQCNDVESNLKKCTIDNNFYGGGSLGKVDGTVTSELDGCTVKGNVFGAGFSASLPTLEVRNAGFTTAPKYNKDSGMFEPGVFSGTTTFTWKNAAEAGVTLSNGNSGSDLDTNHYIYTNQNLNPTNLGSVSKNVSLTIKGNSKVGTNGDSTTGNVYGGGEESNVNGDIHVYICETQDGNDSPIIYGNVFGGGKGMADNFKCDKAMVGIEDQGVIDGVLQPGGTTVTIGNGTVNGNVYGGGEVGRVEKSTEVTIGLASGTSEPIINGSVFGAGKGVSTHGYSALVRGNSKVTVQGKAKVRQSVYGGGEIASVGRYTVNEAGIPTSLVNQNNGYCTVIVQGNAEIGPETPLSMITTSGYPDDAGHVFGAGKGVLPYEEVTGGINGEPWRMKPGNIVQTFVAGKYEYEQGKENPNPKIAYLRYIETLALATQTYVTITGNALVKGSVYGGSMNGHVQHDTQVTIAGGQIGCSKNTTGRLSDDVWGDNYTVTGDLECASWEYRLPYASFDIYDLDGDKPKPATDGHTFYGNVFGGGSGYYPYSRNPDYTSAMEALGYSDGLWHRDAGSVGGNTVVNITGGHILSSVYGGNEQTDVGTYVKDANGDNTIEHDTDTETGHCTINISGGTVGVPRTEAQMKAHPVTCHVFGGGKGDQRINFNTWTNVASTTVNISGDAHIYGSTYGGGENGHIIGDVETTIGGSFTMKINNVDTTVPASNNVLIGTKNSTLDGNVFGGGQGSVTALTAGVVGGNVSLSVQGGHMLGSVYGGGQIASVGTNFANVEEDSYGKMQDGEDHGCITVNLTGGTIDQNVYGGCMGANADARGGVTEEFAAKLGISKTVTVNLNEGVGDAARGCVVKKDIFGCNNVNSSPQQAATVHIYATQNEAASKIAGTDESADEDHQPKKKNRYDVRAVYGGGNLAAYTPVGPNPTVTSDDGQNTEYSTIVIIDGCDRTSIQTVYGGGNAASTPATNVTVNGTYEIEELFGGGNGKDAIGKDAQGHDIPNPGANVGFYDYSAVEDTYPTKEDRQAEAFTSKYVYGSGEANVNIFGGTIHRVFGGSNTKGNVRQTAVTMLDEKEGCTFCVDEAYGGGKSAPMDAEARLLMACIPGLQAAYGGAEAADIRGNVSLNITNGTFDRVFGGNNLSGTISGSITVNVKEVGCKPIKIGELYGGGNQAGYSVYGYDSDGKPIESGNTPLCDDPQVNVISFTSIGNIYGGGYGDGATMVGNPTVNINVVEGKYASETVVEGEAIKNGALVAKTEQGYPEGSYPIPSHASGKIGAINNVFGGGNAAKVIGNTTVNIGTLAKVSVGGYVVKEVEVGASVAGLFTRSGAGTVESPYTYTATEATDVAVEGTTYYEEKDEMPVIGADIRGNVYGGGNEAIVTGNASVNIGNRKE